jgi:hypothetical protein
MAGFEVHAWPVLGAHRGLHGAGNGDTEPLDKQSNNRRTVTNPFRSTIDQQPSESSRSAQYNMQAASAPPALLFRTRSIIIFLTINSLASLSATGSEPP